MDKQQKTLDVIAEISGRPAAEIKPDMELTADLDIDSPKALRLLLQLEDEVGVEISDEEAAAMHTVEDILEHIRRAH